MVNMFTNAFEGKTMLALRRQGDSPTVAVRSRLVVNPIGVGSSAFSSSMVNSNTWRETSIG